jgi:hypothetical protein
LAIGRNSNLGLLTALALTSALGLVGCAGNGLEKGLTAGAAVGSIATRERAASSAPGGATTQEAAAAGGAGLAGVATTLLAMGNSPSVQGSPMLVYERVARGALVCWFGGVGPLKKTHIFNADAAPPSAGGAAEIMIHEREANPLPNQTPRGTRVFRIWFERESEATTRVQLQASRLPSDLAQAMERDTVAWAIGKESCEAQVVRPPPVVAEPVVAKPKKRTPQQRRG